ncbi:MAG: hypothetical protein JWO32_1839 [Bacteroidetes bacterium]|nr:hypothetical protein [Bacteroidota bacterium]
MKRTLQLLFLALILSFSVSAQNEAKIESKRLMTLCNKLEGTYQVQVIDSRDKTEIPLWIMDSIEAKRQVNTVVYFPIKNNVRVMVLPLNVINKKGFVPLPRIANIPSSH